jgi:hypothetical protein
VIEVGKAAMQQIERTVGHAVRAKSASIEAVVTRADGTVENLGVVARSDFTLFGKIKTLIFGKDRS